jgi:carbamoyl-phosphate synthase small subunit
VQITPKFHVVAFDYGVKKNILRMIAQRGARITVVPAQTPAADVLKLKPDGIFLANGPGDPEPCDYAISAVKELIETGIPTFGICLGPPGAWRRPSGAKTFKLKFGHRGANHPVKDLDDRLAWSITSAEPRLCGRPETVAAGRRRGHAREPVRQHASQGLARTDKPAFCFQGHPEASPGPHDIGYLFDRFTALMEKNKTEKTESKNA